MDLDLIARLMRLLETSKLDELDVTENGTRIRLARSPSGRLAAGAVGPASPVFEQPNDGGDYLENVNDNRHVIFAGLPGTFYRRPLPDEPPFVDIGDEVEDGRKLAIVEAMKMMNPVEADCAGRIVEIHLEDGAPVAAGTPLFTLEKAPAP